MRNKSLVLIAFICAFIISILLIFSNYGKPDNVIFSRPEISPVEAQKTPYYNDIVLGKLYLTGDNSVYSLKDGEVFRDGIKLRPESDKEKIDKVLRLALFYQWMKEDPLMFSSTLAVDKFDDSVKLLKTSQDDFIKRNSWHDDIFAVNFLEKFVSTSRAYQEFSENISEEEANNLIRKIEEANEAYSKEAEGLRSVIKKLSNDERWGKKKYAQLGGETYTDANIIISDLGKIKENSLLLQKKSKKREKCLFESWRYCRRPLESFSKPQPISESSGSPTLLNEEDLNIPEGTVYYGPYKVNSPCWQNKDDQYLYVSKECPDSLNYCTETSYVATNTYYYKIGSSKNPFEKNLYEKYGVEVVPQGATNPYTCSNMEYQPKIAAIRNFYADFKDNRFYQTVKNRNNFTDLPEEFKSIIIEGEKAEKIFFEAKYPGENSLEYLANFYGFTYSFLIKNNDLGNVIKDQDRADLLNRYLIIKEKIRDIDLILNKSVYLFSYFAHNFNFAEDSEIAQYYVYIMRNEYSLSFLSFSAFFWRNPQKLQYLERDVTDKQESHNIGIIDYQTAVSQYGKENLEKWTELYNQSKNNRP